MLYTSLVTSSNRNQPELSRYAEQGIFFHMGLLRCGYVPFDVYCADVAARELFARKDIGLDAGEEI